MAASAYKQFLAAPSSSLLADKAALHYVTTTTTVSGPTEIIKHLNTIQKQVIKKKEDVLSSIDGGRVVVLEIDTGLGFQTGGGPYLPGLDDNFLASRVAYLPITHIVTFDEAGKIAQIRLQWDQGSLLKQIEVIGKSGRNWPIRDSREQISFIQACLKSVGSAVESSPSHNEAVLRARGNSTNALRDPHASLQLFGPREDLEAPAPANVVSPYAGNRPRQRSFTEILGDEPIEGSPTRHRSASPSKAGHGKNFAPMRIFDGQQDLPADDDDTDTPKAKRYIRPNPKKFSHFDFADGSDPQDQQESRPVSQEDRPKSKHDSQWSFYDFQTPQKVKPSKTQAMRAQDIRHWDTDKDAMDTPAGQHQPPVKPRRDAETHFELQDDGEPVPHVPRPGEKPRGFMHNEGLGLYKNQLFDPDAPAAPGPDRALGNITNLKDRGKDFEHHFEITDDPPTPQQPAPVPETRKKAVKMMDANWSSYDKSPAAQKENTPLDGRPGPDSKIHIAGDGMGGRKGTNRDWLYGEAEDVPASIPTRKPGQAPVQAPAQDTVTAAGLSQAQRIHIAGDGMGGKKGTNRDWLYGEADDTPASIPTRKPGQAPAQDLTRDTVTAAGVDRAQKIHIAGDGMGGKKGTERDWLYGPGPGDDNQAASVPTRKPGQAPAQDLEQDTVTATGLSKAQRIHIAGDGMGGKKGTNRDWLYGPGPGEEPPAPAPTRKVNKSTARSDFWDF